MAQACLRCSVASHKSASVESFQTPKRALRGRMKPARRLSPRAHDIGLPLAEGPPARRSARPATAARVARAATAALAARADRRTAATPPRTTVGRCRQGGIRRRTRCGSGCSWASVRWCRCCAVQRRRLAACRYARAATAHDGTRLPVLPWRLASRERACGASARCRSLREAESGCARRASRPHRTMVYLLLKGRAGSSRRSNILSTIHHDQPPFQLSVVALAR
jgi:hypothetical protein